MVAKGFTQVPGIDFGETYTLVTWLELIHMILHIGTTKDWDIDHLDIKTAFLHGELDEEIYMEQLEGAKAFGKEDWVMSSEQRPLWPSPSQPSVGQEII